MCAYVSISQVLNIWEGQGYFSPSVLEQIHEVLEKGGSVPDVKQDPPLSTPAGKEWQATTGSVVFLVQSLVAYLCNPP